MDLLTAPQRLQHLLRSFGPFSLGAPGFNRALHEALGISEMSSEGRPALTGLTAPSVVSCTVGRDSGAINSVLDLVMSYFILQLRQPSIEHWQLLPHPAALPPSERAFDSQVPREPVYLLASCSVGELAGQEPRAAAELEGTQKTNLHRKPSLTKARTRDHSSRPPPPNYTTRNGVSSTSNTQAGGSDARAPGAENAPLRPDVAAAEVVAGGALPPPG